MKDLFTLKNGLIAVVILYIISYWTKKSSTTASTVVQNGKTPIATTEETKPDLTGAIVPETTIKNEVAQVTIGDVKNTVVEVPAVQFDYNTPLSEITIMG